MMPIDSPQAVRFSNEKVRLMADKLAQTYAFANRVLNEWNANGGAALIPNTADVIADTAVTDGRLVITGAHANNVVNRASEFIADMEAAGNAKLNTILQVATNTGA